MNRKNTEIGLVEEALTAFNRETGWKAEVIPPLPFPDAGIRIIRDNTEIVFPVEVKTTLTTAAIGVLARQFKLDNQRRLLITAYVAPEMADRLKELDIPFIDAAGNAYINEPRLYLYVKGNKKPDKYKAVGTGKIFKPAGVKVLFALLCNPGLENRPYRAVADQAGVGLGTVAAVMRDLEGKNFLLDMGEKGRRLLNKTNLLTRWVTAYPEQLRPKLQLGRFQGPAENWWEDAAFNNQAYFGGEVAARFITKYLKPQVVTIYADQPLGPLLLENKLKQDPDGDIEILQVFWNFAFDWKHPGLVHPILIYADLIATGDERNIETAQMIYEKELHRFIGPD
jgi:hypothetical protein